MNKKTNKNDLQLTLNGILKNYPKYGSNRRKVIPNDDYVRSQGIPLVKKDLKKNKYKIFGKIMDNYDANCSYGLGHYWASIPWISIYDPYQYQHKHVSPSPQRGIYLVYLFSNELNCVYLSLNMGVTKFAKDYQEKHNTKRPNINSIVLYRIRHHANILSNKLFNLYTHNNNDSKRKLFTKLSDPISLEDTDQKNDNKIKAYECGNILSICYSANKIHSIKDSKLFKDLNFMISIYHDLLHINDNPLTGEPEIKVGELPENPSKQKNKYNESLTRKRHSTTKHTVDHIKQSKRLSSLGDYGERYVVDQELNKLKRYAPNLATKENVHQVSATKNRKGNNGLGYDVISRNIDGSKLHIEVKTTSVNKPDYPFDISDNEVQFAKEFIGNSDKSHQSKDYRLYRVYNARKGHTIQITSFSPKQIVEAANNSKYHQVKSYVFFI